MHPGEADRNNRTQAGIRTHPVPGVHERDQPAQVSEPEKTERRASPGQQQPEAFQGLAAADRRPIACSQEIQARMNLPYEYPMDPRSDQQMTQAAPGNAPQGLSDQPPNVTKRAEDRY